MTRFTRQDIEAIYRTHPLRKETILRRLERQRPPREILTEIDLAEDPVTEITDQNHLGGLAFTRQLAERAGVGASSRILDLGCGLGGAARVLASLFGSRVHGIDLSPERISDARELTNLVGLSHLVSFQCGDVLSIAPPVETFDVIWGQGAWAHIAPKRDFLSRWRTALVEDGRLALEEACLLRRPGTKAEVDLITSLEDHWKCHLLSLDGEDGWMTHVDRSGFVTTVQEDHSAELLDHFVGLQAGARRSPEPVSDFEQSAWRLAIEATRAQLIGYFRLVAEKQLVLRL